MTVNASSQALHSENKDSCSKRYEMLREEDAPLKGPPGDAVSDHCKKPWSIKNKVAVSAASALGAGQRI